MLAELKQIREDLSPTSLPKEPEKNESYG